MLSTDKRATLNSGVLVEWTYFDNITTVDQDNPTFQLDIE